MRSQDLTHQLLASYEDLCATLASASAPGNLASAAVRWRKLEAEVSKLSSEGLLDPALKATAIGVATNAKSLLSAVLSIQEETDMEIRRMRDSLNTTAYDACAEGCGVQDTRDVGRATEEEWYPHRPCSSLQQEGEGGGVLRHWFLSHLPNPYPTYSEKRNLAHQAGIPMSKIDSDLTNWRRRSGWGIICEVYARKSKDRMRTLMLRVQRGEETRPDLLDRVEGIRRYMDKECDKVGDWVHELASFARPEKRPKLDPTDTTPHHGSHRSFSFVSSSSSLSDISATMDTQPSDAHTRDSPSTRSVSGSSTLSDASILVPSQGPKRSMSFTEDIEQVTNKAKTSHTPMQAEPTWLNSPTEYASSNTSGFSGSSVSLDAASNSLSSFTASSESSLPSSESDDGQHTGDTEMVVGSATAVSNILTVADSIMSGECSSIWSTELELPSLPHMHSGSTSSWRIPTLSQFRPEIGRWVERG